MFESASKKVGQNNGSMTQRHKPWTWVAIATFNQEMGYVDQVRPPYYNNQRTRGMLSRRNKAVSIIYHSCLMYLHGRTNVHPPGTVTQQTRPEQKHPPKSIKQYWNLIIYAHHFW